MTARLRGSVISLAGDAAASSVCYAVCRAYTVTSSSTEIIRPEDLEEFKIKNNVCDPDVSLKLEYNQGCSTVEVTNINFLITLFTLIYENTIFCTHR